MSLPNPDRHPIPPILPGTVITQMDCCSQADCRCTQAEPQGPYHHRVWQEAGKMMKEFVPLCDVEAVCAACNAQQAFDQQQTDRARNTAALSQRNIADSKEIVKDAAALIAQSHFLTDRIAGRRLQALTDTGLVVAGLTLRLHGYETALVLELTGEAISESAWSFRATLNHTAHHIGERLLFIDLRGVTVMDSEGWAILVARARSLRKRVPPIRSCVLMAPESRVARWFDRMSLALIMDRAETTGDLGPEETF